MLQKESFVPLYYQLKEEIKEKIDSGEWPPHACIASVRELCATYDISTTTAKQALAELVHEGRLYSVQRKGTFVAAPQCPMEYRETTYITDEMRLATRMRALGHRFAAEVLSVDTVHPSKLAGSYLMVSSNKEMVTNGTSF
ncbi:MAG: GntR family transcriptional regulator [Clostridia bacterium]|nr:GntR family transcriptional regulator [Clostridia bacterium]